MTMARETRTIAAGEFKAKCLALLDEVAESGTSMIVTKRGKPVARLVPVKQGRGRKSLKGSIVHEGDLLAPIDVRWAAKK